MMDGQEFLKKTLLQAELNRLRHGNPEADAVRLPVDWGLIAGEHFGHLLAALRNQDKDAIEKEVLHVSAVLLELHDALKK
ncbi:hypothetical protein [Desulforamulus aeronauticus]|uniref:Uncharacterized protein n=1 Tax=Desulforamulus aeronauticus DSM 10349 TaxID=1121421 RepID=A0A1M6PK24_9FIRM|nr:hypothetical protein [Desulforamulus aeronauticus]SHK08290.1 hypothetical protein SAMN02745123_00630 [Desulforamulus aeronauticus DSM 10349]